MLYRKINKLKQKKAVLLFNSGLDSYLAWQALDKPDSSFLMFNHKSTGTHIDLLRKLKNEHNIENITISSHLFSYIAQNETLYYICLIYHALLLFPTQYIIFPKTFSLTFNTKMFLYLLKGIDSNKRVLCPFLNTTRESLYKVKSVPANDISSNTFSCIINKDKHCGFCLNCIERCIFFRKIGVDFNYENSKIEYNNWLGYVHFSYLPVSLKAYWNSVFTLINTMDIL